LRDEHQRIAEEAQKLKAENATLKERYQTMQAQVP
jgi:hypothetical protein